MTHPGTTYRHDDPQSWLDITREYAKRACSNHPEWDWEDLWGFLYEQLVREQHREGGLAVGSINWGIINWHRFRLGRKDAIKQRHDKFVTHSVDEEVILPDGTETTMLNLIPSVYHDTMDEALHVCYSDFATQLFIGRDRLIWLMLRDGYSQREIGERLKISESRVNQIIQWRIRPRIADALALTRPEPVTSFASTRR